MNENEIVFRVSDQRKKQRKARWMAAALPPFIFYRMLGGFLKFEKKKEGVFNIKNFGVKVANQ